MKKLLILIFMVFMALPAFGAFTESIDTRKTYKNSYRWTGRPRDKLLTWAAEVEDRLTGEATIEVSYYDTQMHRGCRQSAEREPLRTAPPLSAAV